MNLFYSLRFSSDTEECKGYRFIPFQALVLGYILIAASYDFFFLLCGMKFFQQGKPAALTVVFRQVFLNWSLLPERI